jgi:transposase-like protein
MGKNYTNIERTHFSAFKTFGKESTDLRLTLVEWKKEKFHPPVLVRCRL